MPRKKTKSELEIAELRYRSLMEKRNGFNDKAKVVRADMDRVREQKNKILDDLKEMKGDKNRIHERIQGHKRRRDEYQKRAKDLLALKKSKRGKISGNLERELKDLDRKIGDMEKRQETTFMPLAKEQELLDELRKQVRERDDLEGTVEEQRELLKEVKDIDLTIDELFKIANDEHEAIAKLFPEAKKINKKMNREFKKVTVFLEDLNKKRKVLDDLRAKADKYHEKVLEMREKILTIKKSTREDVRRAKSEIKKHNIEVRKALGDKKKIDEKVDESLTLLKKKGKIELK